MGHDPETCWRCGAWVLDPATPDRLLGAFEAIQWHPTYGWTLRVITVSRCTRCGSTWPVPVVDEALTEPDLIDRLRPWP
jgi:hypothetical protein